jgi:CheY-like chemotaxis protein
MACDILVVDDDVDIRETLLELLEGEGYSARGAANGQEALNQLRQGPASVILLDLMMPVMDGFEFRKQQLAEPVLRDIPVIVVSAGGNCERSARELGAYRCMRKPLDVSKLLESIRAARALPAAAQSPSAMGARIRI